MKRSFIGILAIIAILALGAPARGDRNCLHFDGVNDYIAVPHNAALVLTDQATFETWIKVSSFPSGPNFICTRATYYGNPGGYKFGMWNSTMRLLWGNTNTTYFDVTSTSGLTTNTWTHVAVTYIGDTVKWYVNGNLDRTAAVTPRTLNVTSDSLLFGKLNEPTHSYSFAGNLDRFRIWNYARTQEQIQANMNALVEPATNGLVAQYSFNQGVAGGDNSGVTTLYDSSGAYGKASPVDGALRNFALDGSSSNWLVSDAPSAVELVSFDAFSEPGAVRLRWSTASEQGSAFWLVERSHEPGSGYGRIGQLRAAGSSTSAIHYDYNDESAEPGVEYFYRIGEQELNGSVTWYGPVRASPGRAGLGDGRSLSAWPNPFRNAVALGVGGGARIRVFNLAGQMVRDLGNVQREALWDGRDQGGMMLGPGVYFVRTENSGRTITAKVTKIR